MPEFFVWTLPSLVEIVEAASEQDAAEAYLELAVTQIPERGLEPDCFVQMTHGREAPDIEGPVAKFWIAINGDPLTITESHAEGRA